MYEGAIQDLIDALGRLPGIGPKSAQRIAFHILQSENETAQALVDPSIDPSSNPAARAVRTDEAPTDKTQLSGAALLASELGATVISETNHE